MARRMKVPEETAAWETFPLNGLHCPECGELQRVTPSGATCKNGDHGGLAGIGPQDAAKLTSKKLDAEIEKGDREQARVSSARILFGSANAAKKSEMSAQIIRVVEKVFITDIEGTYDKLEAELRLGDQRSDKAAIQEALDNAQTNVRKAFNLWITVKNAREAWEKTNAVIHAGMRTEAMAALQREKDTGKRSKQITDADVVHKCAELFGDEWVTQENEREKYELFESSLKNLAEAWQSRGFNLQAMAGGAAR